MNRQTRSVQVSRRHVSSIMVQQTRTRRNLLFSTKAIMGRQKVTNGTKPPWQAVNRKGDTWRGSDKFGNWGLILVYSRAPAAERTKTARKSGGLVCTTKIDSTSVGPNCGPWLCGPRRQGSSSGPIIPSNRNVGLFYIMRGQTPVVLNLRQLEPHAIRGEDT